MTEQSEGGNGKAEKSAQRLLREIQNSMSDKLTCAQVNALIDLKGLSQTHVCKLSMIDEATFNGWMKGDVPILPARKFDLLELILGVEQGHFVHDRVHLLDLNEKRLPKDRVARDFDELLPMMRGAVRSTVCGEAGNDSWFGRAKIHVIELSEGGHIIVSHIQASKLSSPIFMRMASINWAEHGASAPGAESNLVVPTFLANQLLTTHLVENDAACNELVDLFCLAREYKASRNMGSIKDRMGRLR